MNRSARSWRPSSPKATALPGTIDTSTPLARPLTSPSIGRQASKRWCMIAVPCVALSTRVRRPISPRAGIEKVVWANSPREPMCLSWPRRAPVSSITGPSLSCGTSTTSVSNGSIVTPSCLWRMTRGLPTEISKPSRRIVSMSTERCSRPRPDTANCSVPAIGSTRSATFRSNSFSSRSRRCRVVRNLPERPTSGDVLMPNTIESVGSSTVSLGSGRGSAASQIVSPISTSSIPLTAAMSPAVASSTSTRPSLSNTCTPTSFAGTRVSAAVDRTTCEALVSVPDSTRPMAMRPT